MGLSNLKSSGSRGGFRGNSTPKKWNVFGQVVAYNLKDKNGMRSDPSDSITVALFRDAFGLKAEFAEDGTLLTHIDVSLAPTEKKVGATYEPMTIANIKKGRGAAKPTNIGDFVEFKDVEKVGNEYRARRVEAAVRSFDPNKHYPYSGMVQVRREYYTDTTVDGQPERIYNQMRTIAMVDYAERVTNADELRDAFLRAMDTAAQLHGAEPTAIVRAIQYDDNGKFVDAASIEIYRAWDKENQVHLDDAASFERWAATEDAQGWLQELAAGNANQMFEVIPQPRIRTGRASLPSSRRQAKADAGKAVGDERMIDDSIDFQVLGAEGRPVAAYVASDIILNRMPNDDGTYSRTHSIYTAQQRPFLPRMVQAELVTNNVREFYPALAEDLERRGDEAARAAVNARKGQAQGPAAGEETHDEENGSDMPGMGA